MKKRWLVLLVIVALVVAALGAVLLTNTGLRWVAGLAAPAGLQYERLDGRLVGPVSVTGLNWQQDNAQLTIAAASVDWKLAPLFSRHLHLTSVEADGIRWQARSAATVEPAPRGAPSIPRLPVTVTVDALHVSNVAIEQDDSVFVIDDLRLSARADTDTWRVSELDFRSPALDVSGAAAIGVAAPHDIDADLSWTSRLGAEPVGLAGTVTARGDTDALQIEIGTTDALVATLKGTATTLLTAPGVDAAVEVIRADPRLTRLADDRLGLNLEVRATQDRVQLEGLVDVPSVFPHTLTVTGTVGIDGKQLNIEALRAGLVDAPAELELSGYLYNDLSGVDLEMNWRQLAWPLTGTPAVVSPDGRATLSGSIDDYTLDLNATATATEWPATRIALLGKGTSERFELASATVRPGDRDGARGQPDERITASGLIEWSATPAADLNFDARNLRLERLHRELAGNLDAAGRARFKAPASGAEIAIDLRKLGGQLRGQRLGGSGAVNLAPDRIAIRAARLEIGNARIAASGTIARQIDLQWDVEIPDFQLLWPPYQGSISTAGRATGPRNRPALLGTVDVRALDVAPVAIERLTGRFDVGLDTQAAADIRIDGAGVRVSDVDVGRIAAQAQGTIGAHTVDVEIEGPLATLATQLSGGLDASVWRGELADLRVERNDVGAWQLQQAAAVELGTQRIRIDDACFAQREASLCIDGALARGAPAQADFAITALPIALFAGLLPPGLEYEGQIDGDGFFAWADEGFNGAASLAFGAGRVLTFEEGEENVLIGYQNGRVQARLDADTLQASAHFDLRDDGIVDAQIRTPLQGPGALDGKMQVRIENLSIVPALMPQIGRIDGRLQADLDLAGTLGAPETTGKLRLDATEAVLPDFGITLTPLQVDIATQANEVEFSGQAKSGEGDLGLDGTLRWYEGAPVGRLRLSGNAFRVVDLPEVRIDASPDMTMSVAGREIVVAGEVIVPAANLTPLNVTTGVSVSPDQVIVDEVSPATRDDGWQVDATLRVTAGDAVQVSGFGLKGRLAGSVLIVQQPDQPATGRGTLEVVDGRYRAYGQELAIQTGRLEFTGGPIDDPGLDLRASRQAGDIEAGVQVRGALRSPTLTLYSSPPLSDTETLSYLVTGRGIDQLDEADQTAVSDAATRLALKSGGSLLAKSVGRGLGLDTVEFEDEGTVASTALVVGKQLSPRLFVSYGIGLFEAINTLRLRYRINPRLTLQTESGVNTSADLLYSFDR